MEPERCYIANMWSRVAVTFELKMFTFERWRLAKHKLMPLEGKQLHKYQINLKESSKTKPGSLRIKWI